MAAVAVEMGNPRDDKLQLLESFKPPAYFPPYPVKINSHYLRMKGALREKTVHQWTLQHKVDTLLSPKLYKMLLDMDSCGLAARAYSDAGECELEWTCKFLVMLWIWDDSLDDSEMGKSPQAAISDLLEAQLVMMWSFPDDPVLNTHLKYLLSHLEGQELEEKTRYIESVLSEARTKPDTVYSKETSILCSVYLDSWTDAVTGASPEFCLRMAHGLQVWLSGCLEEAYVRKTETNPEFIDIDDYIKNRRGTSAMLITLLIIDKVYNLSTPDSWIYSPEMTRAMDAVNDLISWHNDIWSFKREVLLRNHTQNIVLLLSLKRKISYTEAAEVTTRMLYDRIADLDQATLDLESVTLPEHRRALDLYILTFRNWVSGCHDWHTSSARYKE